MKNYELKMSFRRRGMTHEKLAALCGMNRSVVTRVLATKPGGKYAEGKGGAKERGKETRPKVMAHLTAEEIGLLGWATPEFMDRAQILYDLAKSNGSGGTMLHVEH